MKLNDQLILFSHVSVLDKTIFTKHLATLIHAGIPLSESLETLAEQTESAYFKQILENLVKDVNNGSSLASSLKKYPKAFDQFYISLIEVGETGGTLEENLLFLSNYLAKNYSLRQKIKGAMLYPALVFAATISMAGFISLFILPKLLTFFDAFEVELPLSTRVLMYVAYFMRDYGLVFFLSLILGLVGFMWLMQTPTFKPFWHRSILKIPFIGKLLTYNQLAQFSRNLGVLLRSGVAITQSLETTSHTLSNLTFKRHVEEIKQSLSSGNTIGKVLEKEHFREFPPLLKRMVAVGEKTGKLEETLLYVADFYEEEIDNVSKSITTILEPALLLTIGLVVGFVALAIIGPIYQLTGSIGQ